MDYLLGMAGKQSKNLSNIIGDSEEVSINERILKECHSMYTHPELGLIQIASEFGLKLLAPRKKVVILLIGNHSAGKSSFINWYIEEHVQKTGVAIETQGFTLVSSGRKRESLMGNATLHLYPHFKPLQQIPGVIDFLSTEISASKHKKFPLVTFVDTPGLVDGDMKYPFDVNAAVLWLGAMADLVFVFFDPIGQALCRRTLNLVEALNAAHADKMRFYLSKADDAGNESDRQRVLMQIVQELCKRPGLNRTGFDMPTIYIPELNKASTCMNNIDNVCYDIEKTINRNIQNALNTLEKDFNQLHKLIKERLEKDQEAQKHNQTVLLIRIMVSIAPMLLVLFILANLFNEKILQAIFGFKHETAKTLTAIMTPVKELYTIIPMDILLALVLISIVYFIWIRKWNEFKPTLSQTNENKYVKMMKHIECEVSDKQKKLYRLYLEQSVGDQDL